MDSNSDLKKKVPGEKIETRSTIKKGVYLLGAFILRCIRWGIKIIRPLIFTVSIIIIVSIILTWIALLFGMFYSQPYTQYFMPGSDVLSYLALFNVYFLIVIPLAFVIAFILRLTQRRKVSKPVSIAMNVFFALNMISLVSLAVITAKQFEKEETLSQVIAKDIDISKLTIESQAFDTDRAILEIGDLELHNEYLISDQVKLKITKSATPYFSVIKVTKARGESKEYANYLANHMTQEVHLKEDILQFDKYIKIPRGQKWRDQSISIEVQVPKGREVYFKNKAPIRIKNENGYFSSNSLVSKVFKMTEEGMMCTNCDKTI